MIYKDFLVTYIFFQKKLEETISSGVEETISSGWKKLKNMEKTANPSVVFINRVSFGERILLDYRASDVGLSNSMT